LKTKIPRAKKQPPGISAQEMRRIDYWTGREFQLPPLLIMENAGRALAGLVRDVFSPSRSDTVLALAGAGINGGAVLAAARILAHKGFSAAALTTETPAKLDPDVRRQVTMFRREGGSAPALRPGMELPDNTIILDGVLGYSLGESLKGHALAFVELANAHASPVVALDVPSGLNPDTGAVKSVAVEAEATLAVGFPKQGILEPSAAKWVGDLYLADVGYPRELYSDWELTPEAVFGDAPVVRLG